jgi:hypothetical protein
MKIDPGGSLPRLSDLAPAAQPPPEPVDLFDRIHAWVTRFVALPGPEAGDAITAWIVHAHCLDAFDTSPRLAALSPEPGSGKTRLLEIVEVLVPNAMNTFNTSVAVLYRSMTLTDPDTGETKRPTILLDEADTVFGPRASKDHEDLRGLLNAGYRRGSTVQRLGWRGNESFVETFPSFAAVAIAGLDDLPETVMTRSVVIRMKRRAAGESVQPYRRRVHGAEADAIAGEIRAWAAHHMPQLDRMADDLPDGIEDRAADVWEPLILIGDAHSPAWSRRIRAAAVAMHRDSRSISESLGIRLLKDVRDVFAGRPAMHTGELLDGLHAIDEAPWADLRGKPLDARGLGRRLARYAVHPKSVRVGDLARKGYAAEDLHDAWTRYLPRPSPPASATSATSATDAAAPTPAEESEADVALVAHAGKRGGLLCAGCGEPMTADLLGDGRHAGCRAP